jgi:hypothetical protein
MEPWKMVVLGVLAIAAAWGAWSWWRYSVGAVQKQQGSGGGHLAPGQSAGYRDRMPTSGAHDPKWIDPGVYDTPQLPTRLVHSLEHGMIVIYYDRPPAEAMESLSAWAGLYGAPWSGLVVVPAPGLGDEIVLTAWHEIVLTAWQRVLKLQPFDPAAAAGFIDRYRGRGPEHPVR